MIPNAYSDILTKNANRQHLNDAVEQFLAKGGTVTDLCHPSFASPAVTEASPAPQPATAPAGESVSEHQDVRAELRDIRAVAAVLHRQLDRIEQQLNESVNEQEGEHPARLVHAPRHRSITALRHDSAPSGPHRGSTP
ncbi:hypothetical protein [Pseudomonas rhizoryzae]|uniref:hypothetical protein n=1 Tax=Pseudomonas rhizoryzae TaxID=2571129 RepID=UPI0010C17784|nr:hypothetical protein [Pseudomonas rhizoryzae]